ncbi:EAL domain-containing protein [Xylanimonas oleitrophica]|nr:EAL domain-containing protein [Xylanimonas oleitrophica]
MPRTILVLTPVAGGGTAGEILDGVHRTAAALGWHLVVVQTSVPSRGGATSAADVRLAVDRADGVVVVGDTVARTYAEVLAEGEVPVVVAAERHDDALPTVAPDNVGTARVLVEHLAEHGYGRVVFVGDLADGAVAERLEGYRDAVARSGLQTGEQDVVDAPPGESGGRVAAFFVLAQEDRPRAVLCATSATAVGLTRALRAADVCVPEDIAVVGFDDVWAAESHDPSITTGNHRWDVLGSRAVELLAARLRDGAADPGAGAAAPPAPAVVGRASCGPSAAVPDEPALDDPAADDLETTILTTLGVEGRSRAAREAAHDLAQEVRAIVDEVERTGAEPQTHAFATAMTPLAEVLVRPGIMYGVGLAVGAYLTRRGQRASTEIEPMLRMMRHRALGAAWHLQARRGAQRVNALRDALHQQYEVGAALMADQEQAAELGWLASTGVPAGVLAVRERDTYVVRGVWDPRGRVGAARGDAVAPSAFPPPGMLAVADPAHDIVLVLPVGSAEGERGVLALVVPGAQGAVGTTYSYWAAMLASTLEHAELVDAVGDERERLGLLALAMRDGQWEWDIETGRIALSARAEELLQLRADEVSDWFDRVHPRDARKLRGHLAAVLAADGPASFEQELRFRSGGTYRWLLMRAMTRGRRPGGRDPLLMGSLADIQERKELEEKLEVAAMYDPVTGLANRRLFLERLGDAMERHRSRGTEYAVMFLDLDRFKLVNDSLGHRAGDELLRAVGERLGETLRPHDIAARFGGDEFAVLCDRIVPDTAESVARRLQEALTRPFEVEGRHLWVTASIGIVTSPNRHEQPEDVLRDADTAMYQAKSGEAGSVVHFDESMHEQALADLALYEALRRALDARQFSVHYQPIVTVRDNHVQPVRRFEALVRWEHPEKGTVGPHVFLPLMTETGLVVPLGRWLIDEVCRQLAAWQHTVSDEVQVSVNLSDPEFWSEGLLGYIQQSLARHGVPASALTVEITEGVIVRRPRQTLELITSLQDAGLEVHVDDFGTGYSSLHMLHRFPVDALKIDRSFVQEMSQGERTVALVQAIIAMSDALGIEVIAEGVEDTEQMERLEAMGCTSMQGYLFGRATGPDGATAALQREPVGSGLLDA